MGSVKNLLNMTLGEGEMMIQDFLPILQTLLATCNIIILVYGGYKFINKPHDTLEEKHEALVKRVDAHDAKFDEINKSLHQGNDKFREQDKTNEVLIRSTFALLEFEVHYCETEHKPISKNLEKAKDDLHEYLAQK